MLIQATVLMPLLDEADRPGVLGKGPSIRGMQALPTRGFLISGVTRDGSGNPLPSCIVQFFRTRDESFAGQVVSDPVSGAYSFAVPNSGDQYYAVAYLAGSPDVAGTTVNTLTGA